MAKITKEQLEKIKDQQGKLQQVIGNIGIIEVNKHEALHAQAVISQEMNQTKKELEEQYGSININMEDGTYTKIEESDDSELSVVKSEN
tara:strand:- start:662 stop:928 length:267 start_codon:yes stop_codon:yes gene_type:complete